MTKAINIHLRTSYQIKVLEGVVKDGHGGSTHYRVIITPGSQVMVGNFKVFDDHQEIKHAYVDRLSPSRFSDYLVKNSGFEGAITQLNSKGY